MAHSSLSKKENNQLLPPKPTSHNRQNVSARSNISARGSNRSRSNMSKALNPSELPTAKRRKTDYKRPWVQDTEDKTHHHRKKKDKIDYQKQNQRDIDKMKHFNKNKQYILIIDDEDDVNRNSKIAQQHFEDVMNALPQTYSDVPAEIFAKDEPQIEMQVVDSLLSHSLTPIKWTSGLRYLEARDHFVLEFDVTDYDARPAVYEMAMNTYVNALKLFYLSRPLYDLLAQKLEVTKSSIGLRPKRAQNIQERLERANAKYEGNTVELELYRGPMPVDDVEGVLQTRDDLNQQKILKTQDPEYLEDVKQAINGQVLQLNGLRTMRVNISKNFAIKSNNYVDFGFSRLGNDNVDTLEVVKKRFEYCTKNASKEAGVGTKMGERTIASGEFTGTGLILGVIPQTNELIVDLRINLGSDRESQKIRLVNKMSELILSKYSLSDFGFIGYTNTRQTVYHKFDLDQKHRTPTLDYVRVFHSYKEYAKDNQFMAEVTQRCSEIKNTNITLDYLGERQPELDLVLDNFQFLAFRVESKYRFVLMSSRPTLLQEASPVQLWKSVNKSKMGENFECSFHNDDYHLGINLNEMYLISFVIDEDGLALLKDFHPKPKTSASGKAKKTEAKKIANGADLDNLFLLI